MKAALIGHGITASLTPAMHEAEGHAQGLDYRYGRMDTSCAQYEGKDIGELLSLAERQGCAGVNVTHPFKNRVVDHLDDMSAEARRIGSVNTVLFRDKRRIGHNTDCSGFLRALRTRLGSVARDRVLLVGAGGAGGAVALALLQAGVKELTVLDQEPQRAEAVVLRFSEDYPNLHTANASEGGIDLWGFDGIVNATPMGMASHPGVAIEASAMNPTSWAADIVYFPVETQFLTAAKDQGCRVMDGTGMALFQAVESFGLITGQVADAVRMERNLNQMLGRDAPAKEACA